LHRGTGKRLAQAIGAAGNIAFSETNYCRFALIEVDAMLGDVILCLLLGRAREVCAIIAVPETVGEKRGAVRFPIEIRDRRPTVSVKRDNRPANGPIPLFPERQLG
jgi:hypothetical protein